MAAVLLVASVAHGLPGDPHALRVIGPLAIACAIVGCVTRSQGRRVCRWASLLALSAAVAMAFVPGHSLLNLTLVAGLCGLGLGSCINGLSLPARRLR